METEMRAPAPHPPAQAAAIADAPGATPWLWLAWAGVTLLTFEAHASEALARKHACVACHQAERKLVGPSWKDIATKYGGGSMTAAQLSATVKRGSMGKWGSIPMPAQAQVPDADLQALSAWILNGHRP